MNEEREITIEDLAAMVKKGFDKTAQRTDLERLEKKIDTVDSRLGNLEHKVNQIDRRLFSIEEDVAEIKIKQHKNIDRRITIVERKLGIDGGINF
jgi:chromosome segregation ATPase